jgi:hypothetical protein
MVENHVVEQTFSQTLFFGERRRTYIARVIMMAAVAAMAPRPLRPARHHLGACF